MQASKERNKEAMKKQTLGMMLKTLRNESGMTQLELAEKMCVTDKAVSKWERDLSCPDINSLPKLAEIFDVSVDELMQVKSEAKAENSKKDIGSIITLVINAIPLAMGVAVVVLSILEELDMNSGFTMLGIGLLCTGLSHFRKNQKD